MGFPGRFLACVLALAVVLCGCRTIEKADPRKRAAEERTQQLQIAAAALLAALAYRRITVRPERASPSPL
jgi:ABC-type uncharacterized transport system auxiliary subunit